jgi:hypothetical protein
MTTDRYFDVQFVSCEIVNIYGEFLCNKGGLRISNRAENFTYPKTMEELRFSWNLPTLLVDCVDIELLRIIKGQNFSP